ICTARPFQAYFVAKILVSRFAAKTRPTFRGLRRKPGQRFAVCGGNPTWQILQARSRRSPDERSDIRILPRTSHLFSCYPPRCIDVGRDLTPNDVDVAAQIIQLV